MMDLYAVIIEKVYPVQCIVIWDVEKNGHALSHVVPKMIFDHFSALT